MTTASNPSFPYRRNPLATTKILAPASTAIQPGDLIWDNSGVAAIASAYTWTSDLATTQYNFAQAFLGVSMDKRLSTDPSTDRYILVMTSGDYSYPCPTASGFQDVGTYYAPAQDSGSNLLDQVLTPVSTLATGGTKATQGIFRLTEAIATGAGQVLLHMSAGLTK